MKKRGRNPNFRVELVELPIEDLIVENEAYRKLNAGGNAVLKESLEDFPEMMEIREVVVDEENKVLAGRRRVTVLKSKGENTVLCKRVYGLTEDQKREFILKDNAHAAGFDVRKLLTEFDINTIKKAGIVVPMVKSAVNDVEAEEDFALELDFSSNYIVLRFSRDIDFLYAQSLFRLKAQSNKFRNGKASRLSIGRVVEGMEAIKAIREANKNDFPDETQKGV